MLLQAISEKIKKLGLILLQPLTSNRMKALPDVPLLPLW
jgi:hypothetical protein